MNEVNLLIGSRLIKKDEKKGFWLKVRKV
jgi:hypothetical protein